MSKTLSGRIAAATSQDEYIGCVCQLNKKIGMALFGAGQK